MTESSTRLLQVFLCHSSGDKSVVRELYRQLNAEDWIDAWLDEMKLLPGQEWDIEIEKAVEEADIVLVCLSTDSVDKEGYVQKELRFVLNIADEKPEGSIFVIPLRLDDCVVPRRLKHWQWVDYFPDSQKSFAYIRLLESFKVRARRLGISFNEPKVEPDQEPVKKTLVPIVVPQKNKKEENPKPERELQPEPIVSTPQVTTRKAVQVAAKKGIPWRLIGGIAGCLLLTVLCVWGGINIWNNLSIDTLEPTLTSQPTKTNTPSPTENFIPSTPTHVTMTGNDGMTILYVPAGEFTMGSDADDALAVCQKFSNDCKLDWFTNEEPPHIVALNAFWIDKTEVTNAMYSKCVNAGVCDLPSQTKSYTRDSYFSNPDYGNYPVVYVNWNMAKDYCEWADRRLPAEAEWEKAARGIDARTYPWGNNIPNSNLLSYDIVVQDTNEVGKYPMGASPYGVLDMAGNAWEWTADWYDVYPGGNSGISPDFGQEFRVLRAGSDPLIMSVYIRSANRDGYGPLYTHPLIGFRCAMDATP